MFQCIRVAIQRFNAVLLHRLYDDHIICFSSIVFVIPACLAFCMGVSLRSERMVYHYIYTSLFTIEMVAQFI